MVGTRTTRPAQPFDRLNRRLSHPKELCECGQDTDRRSTQLARGNMGYSDPLLLFHWPQLCKTLPELVLIGKPQANGGAAPNNGFGGYLSAVRLDQRLDDRQSKPAFIAVGVP